MDTMHDHEFWHEVANDCVASQCINMRPYYWIYFTDKRLNKAADSSNLTQTGSFSYQEKIEIS